MEIIVTRDLCKGCGICVNACPYSAIAMRNGIAVIDQKKCTSCGMCLDVCPTGALQLVEEGEFAVIGGPQSMERLEPETIVVAPNKKFAASGRILALMGQYLIPRVVDVLASYLEQKISPPVQVQNSTTHPTGAYYPYRRRRQRRGRA